MKSATPSSTEASSARLLSAEAAEFPAKSDSPLPTPHTLPPDSHLNTAANDVSRSHDEEEPASSAVRRTLRDLPVVEDVSTLFTFDRAQHVLGSGMYATVFRALPTLEACRRFDLPVVGPEQNPRPHSSLGNHGSHPVSPVGSTGTAGSADGGATFPAVVAQCRVAPVALKEVALSSIVDAKEARNVLREISVLRRLRHPHVAGFVGAVRTKTCVYIAMPLAPGVTLTKLLKASQQQQTRVPEKAVRAITQQLLAALRYVHGEKGMVHRDVKLDNVLVAVADPAAFAAATATATASHPSVVLPPRASTATAARRESSNKPAARPAASAEDVASCALGEGAVGAGSAVGPLGDLFAPSDARDVLSRLYEPHADVHVTLVDFGFARTVHACPPPSACAALSASRDNTGMSPIATPTLPTAGSAHQRGGGPRFPATASMPSTDLPPPPGPDSAPTSPPMPQQGSPANVAAAAPLGTTTANSDVKLAYTPCGAHRFMPPEALAALLKSGSSKRPSHDDPGAAPPHHRHNSANRHLHHKHDVETAPHAQLPVARGEARGRERDVAPSDSVLDMSCGGCSEDAAGGDSDGTGHHLPAASFPALVGGDSDIGSIGAGLAFATPAELRKADPFAVGVVCYALLSLCFPWSGDTPARLLDTMRGGLKMRSAAWDDVTEPAKDFVRRMLRHSAAERPGVEGALDHPWFISPDSPTL